VTFWKTKSIITLYRKIRLQQIIPFLLHLGSHPIVWKRPFWKNFSRKKVMKFWKNVGANYQNFERCAQPFWPLLWRGISLSTCFLNVLRLVLAPQAKILWNKHLYKRFLVHRKHGKSPKISAFGGIFLMRGGYAPPPLQPTLWVEEVFLDCGRGGGTHIGYLMKIILPAKIAGNVAYINIWLCEKSFY